MKKTYIIPVTEISPLFLEGSLLQATMTGNIDGGGSFGGGGGDGNGGTADVKKFDLWAEEDDI